MNPLLKGYTHLQRYIFLEMKDFEENGGNLDELATLNTLWETYEITDEVKAEYRKVKKDPKLKELLVRGPYDK